VAAREDDPELIDLTNFTDPDESLRRAAAGVYEYSAIAGHYLEKATDITIAHTVFMGFVARARGLHEGVIREMQHTNPHAVRPLMRGMLELATQILYCTIKPDYVDHLAGAEHARRKSKQFEAMFHAIRHIAPGMRAGYRDLSDMTHFGPNGIYNTMWVMDEEDHSTGWTDWPHWRSEREFYVSCAQIEELAELIQAALRDFGDKILSVIDPDKVIGRLFLSRERGS
jgi:hypothetical protein